MTTKYIDIHNTTESIETQMETGNLVLFLLL